jgi:preprotein translocase subunit SecG
VKNKVLKRTAKILTAFFCFMLLAAGQLYAQSSAGSAKKFKQTLQWSSDPNVLEYKIEIQNSSGQIIQSVTTEESSVSLALKEGSYRYRITAYDFLGREAVSTGWVNIEYITAYLVCSVLWVLIKRKSYERADASNNWCSCGCIIIYYIDFQWLFVFI